MQKLIHRAKRIFLTAIATVTVFIWYAVFYFESHQNLSLIFFDVGQGDAIFIQAENGNQVLIDGGPNDRILAKLGREMPFWDRSLDMLILTHPHADHLDGLLEVLKRYDVEMVLETGINHSIPEYAEWRRLLKEKNVKIVIAEAGQRLQLSETAYLDILTPFESFFGKSPKNIHDATIISKLNYGSATALLMGDAEKSLEYRLLFESRSSQFKILDSDVMKVGHHGSKTSTSEEFLNAVTPRIATISAGRKNRYGHPHQEVLERLEKMMITLFRTDQEGTIRFVSSGGMGMWKVGD